MQFVGEIVGIGTTSGIRLVVGMWRHTPLGAFADVMIAEPSGRRVLLAPSEPVAELITRLYTFDEVVVGKVSATWSGDWCTVLGPELSLQLVQTDRTWLGGLLRLVPRRLVTTDGFLRVADLPARLLPGSVRTVGRARDGRRMTYGATDVHGVERANGIWRHRGLGQLAPVRPPVGFGFSSTPSRPSVTTVVTTIHDPVTDALPPALRERPVVPDE